MLCIIAGHFGIVSAGRFVFTFHVPLFFLLSGYFLSTKVSFLPFMKQKARQLLVPYYVTGVVLLIVATVVNHFVWPEIDALNNAKSMLGALLYGSGTPHSEPFAIRQIGLLWFLWALFFSTGFTRLALRTKCPLLTVCLIAAAGWASAKVTWLPFSIQPGAMASFFMYLGFLARKHGILEETTSRFDCRLDSALDSGHLLWGFYQYRRLFPLSRASEHRHLDCGVLSRRPRLQGRRATASHRVPVLELLWANNPHRHVLPRDF